MRPGIPAGRNLHANGSAATAQAAPPAAEPAAVAAAPASGGGNYGEASLASVQIGAAAVAIALALDDRLGIPADAALAALDVLLAVDLEDLSLQLETLEVGPQISLGLERLASLVLNGSAGTEPAGGNSAVDSLGTVQIGTVWLDPALTLGTPFGIIALGGRSGIGGTGGNSAEDSIGTVQVGGGNTAEDSVGTAQSGPVTLAPRLAVTDTPTGHTLTVGGSSGVAGNGGNAADSSIGTVQIGGGNMSDSSTGTAQVGPVMLGPTLAVGGTPAVAGPITIGGNGGNTAEGSIATVQIGGGNTAVGSIATVQVGGGAREPSGVSGPPAELGFTPAASPAVASLPPSAGSAPGQTAEVTTPTSPATGGVAGENTAAPPATRTPVVPASRPGDRVAEALAGDTSLRQTVRTGMLPFTGLTLLLVALLGVALVGTGLGLRDRTRTS